MAAGLQTFKSNGVLSFDSNTDMSTYQVGTAYTGTGPSGSLTFAKLSGQRVWVAVMNVNANNASAVAQGVVFGYISPYFTVTDNGTSATISWEARYPCDQINNSNAPIYNNYFAYGVYI